MNPGMRILGAGAGSVPGRPFFAAAAVAVLVAGLWLPIEARVNQKGGAGAPVIAAVAGEGAWAPSTEVLAGWKPHYRGFSSELQQTFRKDGGVVGLYIAYYRNQEKGRELITSGNLLVAPADWNWKLITTGSDGVEWVGEHVPVNRAEIAGSQARLEVFRLYWVDGRTTDSEYVAKARLAWSKLSGRGDDAALIVMYTPILAPGHAAQTALRAFASAMSPSIERELAASRAQ